MPAPVVDQWLAHLEQRNRSPETIRAYRSVMHSYPDDPLAVTLDDAAQWWATQDGKAVKTRQRALATVRSFYAWAIRFDLIVKDPTRRLDAPTQGKRLPRPVSRADLHKVLAVAPPDMYRAVCLGAYAGLRVSEVASLDWSDVIADESRLYVRGKGDKDRVLGMSPLLIDALLPDTGGNVVTGGGAPYTAAGLQRRVNRLMASAGVEGTFHKVRARFATVALAETGNLLAVSRALGHVSPATTALYAASSDSDLDLIAAAVAR